MWVFRSVENKAHSSELDRSSHDFMELEQKYRDLGI